MSSRRWPARPIPEPDESLMSWAYRIACANGSTLPQWVHDQLEEPPDPLDLDRACDPELWALFATNTGIPGGSNAVREMGLSDLATALGWRRSSAWLPALPKRQDASEMRWCPTCLAADLRPHLRRAWRLRFCTWCPTDGTLLRADCTACSAPLDLRRESWKRPLVECDRCGHTLTDAPPSTAAPELLLRAVQGACAALRRRDSELLVTAFLLEGLVDGVIEKHGWESLLASIHSPPEEATVLLSSRDLYLHAARFAVAWRLSTTGTAALPLLMSQHKAMFGRLSHHVQPLPKALQPYRARKGPRLPVELTPQSLEAAKTSLISSGRQPNTLALARMLNIAPRRLVKYAKLMGLDLPSGWPKGRRTLSTPAPADADQSRSTAVLEFELDELRRQLTDAPRQNRIPCYAQAFSAAVALLRARTQPATVVSVCRLLGLPMAEVRKRPDLLAILRSKLPTRLGAQPSDADIDRIRAAIASVRDRRERVTWARVCNKLGVARDRSVRTDWARKLMAEAQTPRDRVPLHFRVARALARIKASGGRLEAHELASQLGLEVSAIEARPDVMRMLQQARAAADRRARIADRRREARTLYEAGVTKAEIARRLHMGTAQLNDWLHGDSFLQPGHVEELREILTNGSASAGFEESGWTPTGLVEIVARVTGMRLHPRIAPRILWRAGLTWQPYKAKSADDN